MTTAANVLMMAVMIDAGTTDKNTKTRGAGANDWPANCIYGAQYITYISSIHPILYSAIFCIVFFGILQCKLKANNNQCVLHTIQANNCKYPIMTCGSRRSTFFCCWPTLEEKKNKRGKKKPFLTENGDR